MFEIRAKTIVVAHAGVALVNPKSMLLFSSFLLMLHILIHFYFYFATFSG